MIWRAGKISLIVLTRSPEKTRPVTTSPCWARHRASRMQKTRQILLEHFDEDVHARLRVNLTGAREQLDRMTPPGHEARTHLTITDDFPYAHAFVMIEAVAGG